MSQSYTYHVENAARELLNGKHVSAARRVREQDLRTNDIEDVLETAGLSDATIISYIRELHRAL